MIFVFKIGNRAQSANDQCGSDLSRAVDQQIFEWVRRDCHDGIVSEQRRSLSHHVHAFFEAEERGLVTVDRNPDHQMINQCGSALEHIDMTKGHWIKSAGIQAGFHYGLRFAAGADAAL